MSDADFSDIGHIAFLTGEYPRATDTFVLREVLGLRALGVEVTTCSIRTTDPDHHVGEEQKAEFRTTFQVLAAARSVRLISDHLTTLIRSPGRYVRALHLALRTTSPGAKALFLQLAYFAEAVVLAAELRRRGVRHLHNHFSNSSCSVAMLMSEVSGIPFSFMIHGPAVFFEAGKWRLDEKVARARFVTCISHFARSQGMIFSDPTHWAKMHILHCAVDPDLYDRPRPAPCKRLLFVGRLAAVKGVPVLLQAVARLRAAHPDLRLTLVGDGAERAALETQSADLGLTEVVEFVGYKSQTEVADLLAQSDIFVLPSFAEGVPVVLMEAMAARLPVVTTRIAGVSELVEDGVAGHLVPPGDLDALTDRLDQLLSNPDVHAPMGAAGRARVVEEFNTPLEARRLAGLFRAYQRGETVAEMRAPLPE